jgi:hypothetical protein
MIQNVIQLVSGKNYTNQTRMDSSYFERIVCSFDMDFFLNKITAQVHNTNLDQHCSVDVQHLHVLCSSWNRWSRSLYNMTRHVQAHNTEMQQVTFRGAFPNWTTKKVRAALPRLFSSLPLDAWQAGPVLVFILGSGSKLDWSDLNLNCKIIWFIL